MFDPYEPLQKKGKLWFPDEKLKVYRMSALPRPRYQVYLVCRIEQAVRHYDYDLLLSEQVRVRRDLLQIDRLREECEYLMETGFDSVEELA